MARRRRKIALSVSLFPFLSILACVIGTLTLMIAALALGHVSDEWLEQADDSAAAQLAAAALEEELETLLAEVALATSQEKRLRELHDELRSRGVDPMSSPQAQRRASDQSAAAATLRARVAKLEEEDERIRNALLEANQELDRTSAPMEAKTISILPTHSGATLVPFFVECLPAVVRVHHPAEDFSIGLDLEDIPDRSRFVAVLRKVRRTRNGSVIFMIRPDGGATYKEAVEIARAHNVRHGKLALPSQGGLDFDLP